MPIYEYVCADCGKLNEVIQKVSDPTPEACSGCGAKGKLEKVVSRSSFVLKGGGWYSDLYSSAKSGGASSSSPSSSESSASSEKSSTATSTPASSPSTSSSSSANTAGGDKK
ncbi:MAG: FmdB family zinc ribbon protein [Myxococcaceae bacterium]